jgi:hypothetical protein
MDDPQPTGLAPPNNYIDALNQFGAKYCHFCSDPCDPQSSAICIRCGSLICISLRMGAAGCIGAQTLEVDQSRFECPVCIGTSKTDTVVLPYYLVGSGLRRTPKISWPLLLVGIQLKNLQSLVLKLVQFTMESNYVLDQEHVRFTQKTPSLTTNISTT